MSASFHGISIKISINNMHHSVESGMNWIGVPKAAQESFVSLKRARAAFQHGIANRRIIRLNVV